MAVTLNASTSSGLVQSADTSGIIELQNNGTTKLTVNSSGATIPTATVTTLNTPTGVLATQNGMTGIAKAWVNYNAVSQTITDSFNISSVTYVSTGIYTINFTTAMPNANYSISACGSTKASNGVALVTVREAGIGGTNPSTSNFQLSVRAASFADIDMPYVFAQVIGS